MIPSRAAFYQPRYNVVDTNVAYQWHLSNGNLLKLSLIGKNILDEEYLNQQLYLGGDGSGGTGLSGFQGWGRRGPGQSSCSTSN